MEVPENAEEVCPSPEADSLRIEYVLRQLIVSSSLPNFYFQHMAGMIVEEPPT